MLTARDPRLAMLSKLRNARLATAFAGCMRPFATVSVEAVKELRARTGAPMMDCRSALCDAKVGGDLEKALDWLRKKGVSMASKKQGRVAAEGLVGFAINDDFRRASIVEVSICIAGDHDVDLHTDQQRDRLCLAQ